MSGNLAAVLRPPLLATAVLVATLNVMELPGHHEDVVDSFRRLHYHSRIRLIWEVFRLIKYSAQADDNSAPEAATWQHHRQDLPSDPKA